ncbi:MAG TPA: hypothetical protein VFG79_12045 [Solirubrobacter sp.]|nr:hypothetical protein [Solirubrobacter sp.]
MSQISMPVRILLVGAVVFLAAWFTVLSPKPASVETTSTPAPTTKPETAFGKAVEKAKAVAGQDDKTTTEAPATATAPTTKPETPAAAAIPPKALAKLPKPVAKAIKAHKVVVLGVFEDNGKPWRPLADDDRYTRNALRKANRYDGEVFVKQVGVTDLVDYGPLVNDLDVHQSPSIVVIDRNLKGAVLTGYSDRVAINQVIADARDASIEPDIKDAYLRKLNDLCGHYKVRTSRWSRPTIPGKRAELAALDRLLRVGDTYIAAVAAVPAPARWRSLKAETLSVLKNDVSTATAMRNAYNAGDAAAFSKAYRALDRTAGRRLDRRFDDAGVTSCVDNRRS